jgi:hypothetical protein
MNPEAIAAFFKRQYKPHAQSVFSIPPVKEIEKIVNAHHAIAFPGVAALYHINKSESHHRDFADRKVAILPGDFFVSDFSMTHNTNGMRALNLLKQRATEAKVGCWLEIFEEDEDAKLAALHAGFIYVASKISAFSDVRGLYGWWDPSVRSRAMKSLPPALDAAEELTLCKVVERFASRDQIWNVSHEVENYLQHHGGSWANHYSNYNIRKTWTAFALKGFVKDDPAFIIKPSEMMRKWKLAHKDVLNNEVEQTTAAPFFPAAWTLASKIPGLKERVRFMRLAPEKGELGRHADISDRFAGVQKGLVARFHVPIKTCDECTFRAWDARGKLIELKLKVGNLYYLDQRKPHAVLNACKEERVHFVVDVFMNEQARALLNE